MLYFRELTEACVGANEIRRRDALENATLDTGLQPLVPYLVTFIAEGVSDIHPLPILLFAFSTLVLRLDSVECHKQQSSHPYLPGTSDQGFGWQSQRVPEGLPAKPCARHSHL